MGGGSLINASSAATLAEISRITTEISVLIDSERESKDEPLAGDRAAFVEQCEALGFDVHVMTRRALENYLPDEAVKTVKGKRYRALDEFEPRNAVDPVWGKNENWRIAAEVDKTYLDGTDLGRFFATSQRRFQELNRSPERDSNS